MCSQNLKLHFIQGRSLIYRNGTKLNLGGGVGLIINFSVIGGPTMVGSEAEENFCN